MIVAASDFHGDASTAGFPRFDDVLAAGMESVEYAVKHNADAYVFCGDFITNDPSLDLMVRCIGIAKEMLAPLKKARIQSFWMSGNHDVFEDGRGTTAVDLIPTDDLVTTVTKGPTLCCLEDYAIILLPYVPPSHSYMAEIGGIFKSWGKCGLPVKAIFGHLNVEGITPGSEVSDFPRGRDVFFPIGECRRYFPDAVLVNGHIHKRQVYNGVHIVGSLVNLTRGEVDNEPGFLVIDT